MNHPSKPSDPSLRVLVIEDEPSIADTITYALRTDGFAPSWCATVADARAALGEAGFALVVLDIGLPDGNGFDFFRELQTRVGRIPVIFLTSRSSEIDRVVGLEMGADDYMVKPFSPRELVARVRAVLRRISDPATSAPSAPAAAENTVAPSGGAGPFPFVVDEARCLARYHGTELDLTRREYRLLLALLSQPGRVFTREQLLQRAWDEPEASLDRTVDAHVKTLRAKLRAIVPGMDPIRTHRGFGYSFDERAAGSR